MSTGQAAKLLGITVKTLQRWEREGRLIPAARTASNRRRYTETQLHAFLRLRLPAPTAPRRIVAYCRVSSPAQRPDLVNQRRVLEQFTAARGLAGVEYIEEVGALVLAERTWTCAACGARHDRDVNAAINFQRLATDALAAGMALPEASQAVTPGTAAGPGPAGGGKVTPVRHEHGQQDGSGQEEDAAHVCARFR